MEMRLSGKKLEALSGSPTETVCRPSALKRLRMELGSRWPEWTTLSFYAALVAYAIPYHEPWTDEAQAWQIARSVSLSALFQTNIRHEATTGLWHFLLWVLIRAHVNYTGLHWICGAIAVAGVSLFVLKSPFPRYLKLAFPFTYFLLFQYAVIARSYVLMPLLLFLIAIQWRRNPLWIGILLGLMANLSVHAAVISGGLAVVYLLEWIRGAEAGNRNRRLLFGALVLVFFYAAAIWTVWPPHDLPIASFRAPARPFFICAVASISGICQPWLLSIPFWIAIALCLRARRSLFYLLPVLFFAVFCGAVYEAFWHGGLLTPLAMCLLWISWREGGRSSRNYEIAGRAALILMAGGQILWSADALVYDHFHAYSPSLATAQFLKPFVREGDTIAVTYLGHLEDQACDDVAILPYFDRNIFANQQYPFWWWGEKNMTEANFLALLPSHPRIVVAEARPIPGQAVDLEDAKVDLLTQSGYHLTNEFCGNMPFRMEVALTTCDLIFQRSTDSTRHPTP
jgi:hypothetical protein